MGYSGYTEKAYQEEFQSRDYAHKSGDELFRNTTSATRKTQASSFNKSARVSNTDVRPEMLSVGVRESRDTDTKKKTPIIIAFDVTGSMLERPEEMIKDQFPKLMNRLLEIGVRDPEILFLAVGDSRGHTPESKGDDYPFQGGQFEGEPKKVLDDIQEFYLEGGGCGNEGEDYLLAWIVAGYHTETDSWYKRHKKGFLFTLGDEACHELIAGCNLVRCLGYEKGAKDITAEEALEKAREQYECFHIHVTDAAHSVHDTIHRKSERLTIEDSWKNLIGSENFLTCKSTEVAKTISETIREHYVADPETSASTSDEEVLEVPAEEVTKPVDDSGTKMKFH